jgi:hypothetical protein
MLKLTSAQSLSRKALERCSMIGVQVTGHARIDTFVQGIDSETRAKERQEERKRRRLRLLEEAIPFDASRR